MKGFKTLFFAIALFGIFQCKKDQKVALKNILPNGLYDFGYTNQFGTPINFTYKIIDNNFYFRIGDTICMEKIAGQVYKDQNGIIKLTKLQTGYTSFYPCNFHNELFGGDTFAIICDNVSLFTDQNGKVALKGDCSVLMNHGIVFPKLYGPFGLLYFRFQ